MDRDLKDSEAIGLSVEKQRDITPNVMRGWDVTRTWFSNDGVNGNTLTWMISVFARLQIARHSHYLENTAAIASSMGGKFKAKHFFRAGDQNIEKLGGFAYS
jgi:hypothetical protein